MRPVGARRAQGCPNSRPATRAAADAASAAAANRCCFRRRRRRRANLNSKSFSSCVCFRSLEPLLRRLHLPPRTGRWCDLPSGVTGVCTAAYCICAVALPILPFCPAPLLPSPRRPRASVCVGTPARWHAVTLGLTVTGLVWSGHRPPARPGWLGPTHQGTRRSCSTWRGRAGSECPLSTLLIQCPLLSCHSVDMFSPCKDLHN